MDIKFCSGAKQSFRGWCSLPGVGPTQAMCFQNSPKGQNGEPWLWKQQPPLSWAHPGQVRLTIHITGHLAKHGQVGFIDDRAEDPPPAMLILPEDPLPGHAEGHHPHSKEEQEEEHVDQLSGEDIRTKSGWCPGGGSAQLTTERAEV